MRKFKVIKQFDQDGNHIGYSKPRAVSGDSLLRPHEETMWGNVDSDHLKVEFNNGEWVIALDDESESNEIAKGDERKALLAEIEGLSLGKLNTVAKLQPVVLKLAKALKDLL